MYLISTCFLIKSCLYTINGPVIATLKTTEQELDKLLCMESF